MTDTDKKLYELIGDKTLSFGCLVRCEGNDGAVISSSSSIGITSFLAHGGNTIYTNNKAIEIIGHEPTLTDLHRWLNGYCGWPNNNDKDWYQSPYAIHFSHTDKNLNFKIPYDSSKKLIDQSEETLNQIISLIESN